MHRHSDNDQWVAAAEASVRGHGQRLTAPRRAVIRALAGADHPLKADEVRSAAGMAESDLVTVYRNLEALRSIGLVQRIVMENGVQLFEPVRGDRHFHHIVCRECHQTEEIHVCFGHDLEKRALQAGYANVDHVIEVFGVCPRCQDK